LEVERREKETVDYQNGSDLPRICEIKVFLDHSYHAQAEQQLLKDHFNDLFRRDKNLGGKKEHDDEKIRNDPNYNKYSITSHQLNLVIRE